MAAGPGFGSITVSGYFAADWYAETHHVAKVVQTATNTSLQFASYSRYGICEALEGGCPCLKRSVAADNEGPDDFVECPDDIDVVDGR